MAAEEEVESWDGYESGPFCRHYSDPSDCDEKCAACGHECRRHDQYDPGECLEDNCTCNAWKEAE